MTRACIVRLGLLLPLLLSPTAARAQSTEFAIRARVDTVTFRFVDADLRAVIQALGRHLAKPVISTAIPAVRVTLETPLPVDRSEVARVLRGLVEAHGLSFQEDSAFYRVLPAPPPPAPAVPVAAPAATPTPDPGAVQLFVIRLKHARAVDVAGTINSLFGGSGSYSGQGLSSGTLSEELSRRLVPPSTAGAVPMPTPAAAGSRGASLSASTTLVPDALTNALMIRATQADFDLLRHAVDELDIRPLQVLIEVLIVEARRDRSFSLGSDLALPSNGLGGDQSVEGSIKGAGTSVGDLVLHFMNLGKANVDALLRTQQSRGNVRIVSRPALIASNNVEATLLVGSQRPFVQLSRSLPTDAASRDQIVQYRDVGTKLTVRPTINQDGYVSLLIQQEISQATSEVQFGAPIISSREARTQVLARDGQTIVLGGINDLTREKSSSGIPILSGIPIIGGLFGSTSKRTSETELFLFLTPRIIRSDEDVDRVTTPHLPRLEGDTTARSQR